MRGVTSNPTIFANALAKGDAYDEQIKDLALRGVGVDEASRMITTYDIRWAADVLRPAYDSSNGVDGRVSIEVDPGLARDTAQVRRRGQAAVVARRPAQHVHQDPGHRRGPPAITATLAEGVSVNVTLIFSLAGTARSSTPSWAALSRRRRTGTTSRRSRRWRRSSCPGWTPRSTSAWSKIGTPEALALKGKAAIANARLAYKLYKEKRHRPVARARREGREGAAAAVGVDLHQGPGVPRHPVRCRAGGRRHREHHAGGDDARDG